MDKDFFCLIREKISGFFSTACSIHETFSISFAHNHAKVIPCKHLGKVE